MTKEEHKTCLKACKLLIKKEEHLSCCALEFAADEVIYLNRKQGWHGLVYRYQSFFDRKGYSLWLDDDGDYNMDTNRRLLMLLLFAEAERDVL